MCECVCMHIYVWLSCSAHTSTMSPAYQDGCGYGVGINTVNLLAHNCTVGHHTHSYWPLHAAHTLTMVCAGSA